MKNLLKKPFFQHSHFAFILAVFTVSAFSGCTTRTTTTPARSATEELLLSTSVDRAMTNADLSIFDHQKVFVDQTYFDSYDPKYAVGTVRDALSREGALLMASAADADIIVEPRSGGISIDGSQSLIGIPSMGVPIPLAGAVQTPEIAFYKADKQHSYSKIAILAYAKRSGAHLYSSGSLDGKAYNKYYSLLGISWVRNDIPEKKSPQKKVAYESWQAQYDPQALLFPTTTNAPAAVPTTNAPANSVTNTPANPATNGTH